MAEGIWEERHMNPTRRRVITALLSIVEDEARSSTGRVAAANTLHQMDATNPFTHSLTDAAGVLVQTDVDRAELNHNLALDNKLEIKAIKDRVESMANILTEHTDNNHPTEFLA